MQRTVLVVDDERNMRTVMQMALEDAGYRVHTAERADDAVGLLRDPDLDVVLSDLAAPTTGHRQTDHLRTMHLCEVAAWFAVDVLAPGGHFLAKTFQGGTEADLLAMLKRNFRQVIHIKPPSSRAESVEMYLLAMGFRGEREKGRD